ncbi:MAG: eukaryotic translation initiation factor 4E [Nitrososphaerota archaeon]
METSPTLENNLLDSQLENKSSSDYPLTHINLPNPWVLYLYDKQAFKKIASSTNYQVKPHKEVCTITTVNDLIYILQLMEVKNEPKIKLGSSNDNRINLDANDYIIMRKGIEPIWEDPKNCNGGTFSIKMDHSKGYNVWSTFVMYMLGETLTEEMQYINGITVSYISDETSFHQNLSADQGSHSYTYIKIWDAKPNRTRDQFVNILPADLLSLIKNESLMYIQNNKKRDFNEKSIISKLKNSQNSYSRRGRGGFYNRK